MKRALIVGPGGLNGAYSAGFLKELYKHIKPEYFDSIYGYSVGVFASSFYISGQTKTIKEVWENKVNNKQLINPLNIFHKKKILNIDNLINLFKEGKYKLDTKKIINSKTKLYYFLTNYYTGKLEYAKPNEENMFNLMKASCSIPIVYGKTKIKNNFYLDPFFVYGGIPFLNKIKKEYGEIIILLNFPEKYKNFWINEIAKIIFYPIVKIFYPTKLQKVFIKKWELRKQSEIEIKNNKKIRIIRPSTQILKSSIDTDRKRIIDLMKLGEKDAIKFYKSINH